LLEATALNMTNMIGVGPFVTIPALMTAMHGPQAMMGWFVALGIAACDGLVWSELGAAMPGSGGSYVYLRDGFGRHTLGRAMAFLFVWQFILSGPLEIASGYIGFKQYMKYLWPGMGPWEEGLLVIVVGLLAIALLYRKITALGKITVALWAGTLLTVGVVVVSGVFHFDTQRAFAFEPGAFQFSTGFLFGLGAASRIGMYDYLGYYDVCFIGDEVKDPGRVIPRSVLFSLLAVAAIYVTMNLSIISVVPWQEFVPPKGEGLPDPPPPVVSMFVEKLYGGGVAKVFTALVLWTAFGSCFALLLGYSRIPYAAAKDGNFFRVFDRLHPTEHFPHVSLLLIGGLSIAFSFFKLQNVIEALLATRILVQFVGQIGALIWLRRMEPQMERPFRMWLYPIPALVAFCGWGFLYATSGADRIQYSQVVVWLGVAAYALWAWRTKRWPFEKEPAKSN
jgi:amino acid transporter